MKLLTIIGTVKATISTPDTAQHDPTRYPQSEVRTISPYPTKTKSRQEVTQFCVASARNPYVGYGLYRT